MNLKEAFRYCNFLDSLLQTASTFLVVHYQEMVYSTTRVLKRSAVKPEFEDVTETAQTNPSLDVDNIVSLIRWAGSEKGTIAAAIEHAKIGTHLDSLTEANKSLRTAAQSLHKLLEAKESTTISEGRSTTFNAEGNPVEYSHPVETRRMLTFNREDLKNAYSQILAQADENSAKIDRITVSTMVDYMPRFNVNDTFDDVLEAFAAKTDK